MSRTHRHREEQIELLAACSLLFGIRPGRAAGLLLGLREESIKRAFRRRARESHPDRTLGRPEPERRRHLRLFLECKRAHDRLVEYLARRGGGASLGLRTPEFRGRPPVARPAPSPSGELFYRGRLPERRLLIGQFLFFSGHISFQTLVRGIVWQRRQRPTLGELLAADGFCRERLQEAMLCKRLGEPIGEALVRCGALGRRELNFFLSRQRRMQRFLGEYFLRHLEPERLAEALRGQLRHNLTFPSFLSVRPPRAGRR